MGRTDGWEKYKWRRDKHGDIRTWTESIQWLMGEWHVLTYIATAVRQSNLPAHPSRLVCRSVDPRSPTVDWAVPTHSSPLRLDTKEFLATNQLNYIHRSFRWEKKPEWFTSYFSSAFKCVMHRSLSEREREKEMCVWEREREREMCVRERERERYVQTKRDIRREKRGIDSDTYM